jgi:hypothetical protein
LSEDDALQVGAVADERPGRWKRVLAATLLGLAATIVVLHLTGALTGAEAALSGLLPEAPVEALKGYVDVFTCCVFTWRAFSAMLPAFVLGGAISAFVPPTVLLRYLGARSNPIRAYLISAISGVVLAVCSCNVVPLFVSIYRRGAGIGPAFTFLYAGPAINIVAIFFTINVIGWKLGIWRAAGVPLIGILAGVLMALFFRREHRDAPSVGGGAGAAALRDDSTAASHKRVWVLMAGLLALVVIGSLEVPKEVPAWVCSLLHLGTTPIDLADGMRTWIRVGVTGALVVALAVHAVRRFDRDELRDWGSETWGHLKLVIPILIPVLLLIGAMSYYTDIKLVYALVGPPPEGSGFLAHVRPIALADLFGALMYFPVLSEVGFTKAYLKLGMDVGPALALLLTGAGLSLPGLFIVAKAVGWKKSLVYEGIVITLTLAFAWLFSSEIGQYICSCMMK